MEHMEDAIGSAKPPKPPGPPRDHERTKRALLIVIAVGTVAAAAFCGVTAWETRQQRIQDRQLYCASYTYDYESDEQASYDELDGSQKAIVDILGCDLADD